MATRGRARTIADHKNYNDILFEIRDDAAWITIDRPRVLNAIREQTLDEILDAVRSVRTDPSIVCIVITGSGEKSFCAGGDFHATRRLSPQTASLWNERVLALAMAIRGAPVPVIAMVNGWCMGAGQELTLWCDLVIAAENAVFGLTGARLGTLPTSGATQYLPRMIGERLAREMMFLARRFNAQEAVDIGLINRCVAQRDLVPETVKWCRTLKGHSPLALRLIKRSLNFESDQLYASWQHGMEFLAHARGSGEAVEGLNAFIEDRKPDFQSFRMRNKAEVEAYAKGVATGRKRRPTPR
jgi:dihydroxynaphthoic acid synthetase